jgi:carbonic anhydrase/acetyltransferase-like protein (isoleucine patch superfamily)
LVQCGAAEDLAEIVIGCRIGKGTLIGMGAIDPNGAGIGEYALVGAGATAKAGFGTHEENGRRSRRRRPVIREPAATPQRRILEVQPMDNLKAAYETMLGLAAEMVLDEALRKYRTEKIYEAIDNALEQGDAASFRRLTDELKAIQ